MPTVVSEGLAPTIIDGDFVFLVSRLTFIFRASRNSLSPFQ